MDNYTRALGAIPGLFLYGAVGNELVFAFLLQQKAVQIGLAQQKWFPAQDTPEGGFGAQKMREVVTSEP